MINSGREWDWMDDKKDNKKITLEEYERRRKEREYYLKRGNNTSGTID
jgi:hypothetical protein